MTSLALLIDFGSTFTKVVAVDLSNARVVGRSQAPSTVLSDVREGLVQALVGLNERYAVFGRAPRDLSVLEDKVVLAASSAAGGLRIVVVGNVPGLTVEAANQAALGAGAKVVGSASFKLSEKAHQEVVSLRPDMILLTGGTDGGDAVTILHNARMLASFRLAVPIVVAGNKATAAEVCEILTSGGKEFRLTENVMPKTGTLAVESAREEIRKLFMERITRAKGLDKLQGIVPVVLPTPMAVLDGVRLGADGIPPYPSLSPAAGERIMERGKKVEGRGWGDMLVVDVGGATTDVHSIGYGQSSGPQFVERGLPEPYAKRTVEGDLGIRFNAGTLLERVGLDRFASELRAGFPHFNISPAELALYIEQISQETARVPLEDWHGAVDAQLARVAVDLAVERHVGKKERVVTREGEAWVYYGKDLSETRTIIGTGGVFIYNAHVSYILSSGAGVDRRYDVLRPKNPTLFIDASYLLYAVGLLSRSHPEVALRIFKNNMKAVNAP
ncbi:MAG: glutamate mutase L [Deltaproteobacteria bacterium]|nr:glutamate mutase L [Deltaproteobacteria bacterium]